MKLDAIRAAAENAKATFASDRFGKPMTVIGEYVMLLDPQTVLRLLDVVARANDALPHIRNDTTGQVAYDKLNAAIGALEIQP